MWQLESKTSLCGMVVVQVIVVSSYEAIQRLTQMLKVEAQVRLRLQWPLEHLDFATLAACVTCATITNA